jgi:hypothetical protein
MAHPTSSAALWRRLISATRNDQDEPLDATTPAR